MSHLNRLLSISIVVLPKAVSVCYLYLKNFSYGMTETVNTLRNV